MSMAGEEIYGIIVGDRWPGNRLPSNRANRRIIRHIIIIIISRTPDIILLLLLFVRWTALGICNLTARKSFGVVVIYAHIINNNINTTNNKKL
jgi:hypothetical protein